MSIQTTPNAGGQSERDESLSESDLIDLMAGEEEQQEETEETDEEVEDTDAEEEVEETETDDEETETDDEEPEGIDLENLTDEQWELVRTRLKSRAAADIQRLKRESKAKDAQIAALQGQQPQGATSAEPVESRFLKDVDTVEKLSEKVVALKKLAKDTERILDDHEDYGPQDYIEVGDKSYTKRQLKELSREIRDTLDEAVPYYQSKFQRHSLIEQESVEAMTTVRKSVAEIGDEKSPVAKTFKDVTESEMFQKIYNAVPEARPVLTLLAGFGTKGILAASARKGTAPAATGKPGKANPPSTPSGAAGPSQGRSGDPKGKKAAVLEKRFQESGDPEDLIKALSAV